jgi:hypothetical protein
MYGQEHKVAKKNKFASNVPYYQHTFSSIDISIGLVCPIMFYKCMHEILDRLCGLVVRVPGYRSRDSEFDSRHYQISK